MLVRQYVFPASQKFGGGNCHEIEFQAYPVVYPPNERWINTAVSGGWERAD
jgi:hypothetical protein